MKKPFLLLCVALTLSFSVTAKELAKSGVLNCKNVANKYYVSYVLIGKDFHTFNDAFVCLEEAADTQAGITAMNAEIVRFEKESNKRTGFVSILNFHPLKK